MKKQKEIKRFELDIEAKLIKKVNCLLNQADNSLSEDEAAKKKFLGVQESANVCMVIAKSEEAKRFLCRFVNREDPEVKEPKLDYNVTKKTNIKAKYSTEYLKIMIEIFNVFDYSVYMQLKTDYPITMSNEHFKIILAPRVSDD